MVKDVVPKCIVDGCTVRGKYSGYCSTHYDKLDKSVRDDFVRKSATMLNDYRDLLCKSAGCRSASIYGDFCKKHSRNRALKPLCSSCGKRSLGDLGYCAPCWDKMHRQKLTCACGKRANVTGLCSKCRKVVPDE